MDKVPTPEDHRAYKEHKKKQFIEAFANIGTIIGAAKAVAINRDTVLAWRKADKDFDEAFQTAQNTLTEKLESVAMDKALAGNETMLIFMLKARSPKKYLERFHHQIDSPQIERLIGLFIGIVKRTVPQEIWPRISAELQAAADTVEMGGQKHLLQ